MLLNVWQLVNAVDEVFQSGVTIENIGDDPRETLNKVCDCNIGPCQLEFKMSL